MPLIFHWPVGQRRIAQDRLDQPLSLLDVAPTILGAIGLPQPSQMRGRSLISPPATSPGRVEEIYSESLYAQKHFGCEELECVRLGRYKFIDAPEPELYDLATDPGELHNIYERQRAIAAALYQRIVRRHPQFAATRSNVSPPLAHETVGALRSLGYLSGSNTSTRLESHIDPKDRIEDFERYGQAVALASDSRLAESTALLQKLGDKLADVMDIRVSLGLNLQRLGQNEDAEREFRRVLRETPSNAASAMRLRRSSMLPSKQIRILHRPAES